MFEPIPRGAQFDQIVGAAAASVEWHLGDIADGPSVRAAAEDCDAIVHLAGILTPACKDDPVRGAMINLVGTLNVFNAARALSIRRIVFTSSAGVYGPDDETTPRPMTHYGTFKLACEGSARAYWADHGMASVGFRPYIVYGYGRESGSTAGPSLACRAAARGKAYVIPYIATAGLVFVDDVVAAYEAALRREPHGAHVFNLPGEVVSNEDVVAAVRAVVPNARIAIDGPVLPFAADIGEGDLRRVFPNLPATSLRDGIRRTIELYRRDDDASLKRRGLAFTLAN
ncbi:NAD(P)-dependent oxidoreductase [Bradyrhizobium sp. WSM3983]|uniref:NAD-dependent epimerase/dehydratase family protein n=1 Tax=Bradyrhizobium sp. WSM3983 TaxID=1038867 RepID=UPI001FD96B5F|nr:SDR family oxidoreductase [Bradyrhizobium sp. WSM3983]